MVGLYPDIIDHPRIGQVDGAVRCRRSGSGNYLRLSRGPEQPPHGIQARTAVRRLPVPCGGGIPREGYPELFAEQPERDGRNAVAKRRVLQSCRIDLGRRAGLSPDVLSRNPAQYGSRTALARRGLSVRRLQSLDADADKYPQTA